MATNNAIDRPGASQADQEARTSTTTYVQPGVQQYHPGHPKAWVNANIDGTFNTEYNVTSITDTGVGQIGINFTVSFAATNYCGVVTVGGGSTVVRAGVSSSFTAGTFNFSCTDGSGTLTDPAGPNVWTVACFGDQ